MDLLTGLVELFAVVAVAAVAPLVAALIPHQRVPQVVLLILGGILIGPQGLGLQPLQEVELVANVGLGFVFLLAGFEIDPAVLFARAGKLALVAWVTAAVLATVAVGALAALGYVRAFVPVALALTTTALGTVLPILREQGMLDGAVGALLPRVGSHRGAPADPGDRGLPGREQPDRGARLDRRHRPDRAGARARSAGAARPATGAHRGRGSGLDGTDHTAMVTPPADRPAGPGRRVRSRRGPRRAAGRSWCCDGGRRATARAFESKLDAVGYGFFIPVFFVVAGMRVDLASIMESPERLFVFLALLLMVRGLPVLVIYRRALCIRQRTQLMFFTATTLPLIVALTEIGLNNGTMRPENAAALVGAGVLSVLVFPLVAVVMDRPDARPREAAASPEPG